MSEASPIDVVEAAYRVGAASDAWLRTVLEAAAPLLHPGTIPTGYFVDFSDAHTGPVQGVQCIGGSRAIADRLAAFHNNERDISRSVLLANPMASTGSQLARAAGLETEFAQFLGHFATAGVSIADTLGVVGLDPTRRGVVLTCIYDRKTTLSRALRGLWTRVAVHLAAGARLRSVLAGSSAESQPDAVLSPSGRLEHAEGEAKEPLARESLRASAVAIDRARGRLRRSDPDAALETWTGLVSGRWSLVDRFESDGRRYVVAHRNEATPARSLALTLRERQVVGHLLLGQSSKLTAYALGVSPAAVSGVLRTAMQKLGVRNKAQLPRALGDIAKGGITEAPI